MVGACTAPPAPPRLARVTPLHRAKGPGRPAVKTAAPDPARCGEADPAGLTEAQRAALFARFDAWQSGHGKGGEGARTGEDVAAPSGLGPTLFACRGPGT